MRINFLKGKVKKGVRLNISQHLVEFIISWKCLILMIKWQFLSGVQIRGHQKMSIFELSLLIVIKKCFSTNQNKIKIFFKWRKSILKVIIKSKRHFFFTRNRIWVHYFQFQHSHKCIFTQTSWRVYIMQKLRSQNENNVTVSEFLDVLILA